MDDLSYLGLGIEPRKRRLDRSGIDRDQSRRRKKRQHQANEYQRMGGETDNS